jgi:predicted dehydrogenase
MPADDEFQSRRDLLRATGAAAVALTTLPAWFARETLAQQPEPSKPASPTDRPGVLLVGCGGQGTGDAKLASRFGDVVACCDVDEHHLGNAAESFPKAKQYRDFRQAMQHPGVDLVVNGTPDHWHTLVNLAALNAGKDVYSEKPLTLTIDEGKRLVAAVKQSDRVLQTGSQQRSDARFRLACEVVRNGRLGKLTRVTTILPAGLNGGPFKPTRIPTGLDWEMYQGQAPDHEYLKERTHLTFRYWLDYSGGTLTDWGAHHNDIALWALGLDRSGPVSVEGKVLARSPAGGYTAPAEYKIEYAYANGVKHTCVSTTVNSIFGTKARDPKPGELPHGVKFEGPDGWVYVTRGRIEASKPELLNDKFAATDVRLPVSTDHMANFFESVRTRKPPICDAEIGHRSASVCHLGGIALRLGRNLTWDPAKEEFVGDKEANALVARVQRKKWCYETI